MLLALQLNFLLQKSGEEFSEKLSILAKMMFQSSNKQQSFGNAVCW